MGQREVIADLEHQAAIFGIYLVGKKPEKAAISLYVHAMRHSPALSPRDSKLLAFGIAHPWLIGCIDGGLVFFDPHSEIRRRLYVMFAILEAQPEYSNYFLPRQRSPLYILLIGLVGVRAVYRALIGLLLVRVIR